jgi:hypothetical protein
VDALLAVRVRRACLGIVHLVGGPSHVPTTTRELAHVLMDADVDAPLWFRECFPIP